ncbi:MAG: GNAT family N-acetyltransferase [Bryobacterales bacterium]|nr:GNAT family N-acetyltransferase [Bryobacterales bacterium]
MRFRLATSADFPALEAMIIASFEPISWFQAIDAQFGTLNGHDWHARWQQRLAKLFAEEIILIGETDEGEMAAAALGTYDAKQCLGFVDLLAVSTAHQGQGLGREMLRAMLDHFRKLGARHAHLDCLTSNERGMKLYESEGWTPVATSMKWFTAL